MVCMHLAPALGEGGGGGVRGHASEHFGMHNLPTNLRTLGWAMTGQSDRKDVVTNKL